MADNRIYLKCSICGDELLLGKSFYNGLYYKDYSNEGVALEDKLNKFYQDHIHFLADDCNLLGTNFYIYNECFTDERINEICNLYD